ncbi:hypothetical protein OROHE_016403 [Orobanche hederae]
MRIHNFRVIFNEYDAILSPTYVGHIIIKVCVVGFGRTNDQFSRNTVTSGFSLATRIHDFGLSEENDAIILRTYVGHTIVKVCVVGFGRKNDQFSRNYDAVLLCSYIAHVIIKGAYNENPLFQNNSDEYGASLTHSYIAQVITTVCVVRCGRNNNQFLRNTGTPGFRLAMKIYDFGPILNITMPFFHVIHNFRLIFNEYDAIISPTYVGHIIIKVCLVGFGRTNDQFSRNTVTSGFRLAMRIHDFGLSEENDAIILGTYVGHIIIKVCVVYVLIFNEYDAILSPTYIGHIIIKVCVVGFGRTNDQFSRNTATLGFSLAMRIHDFGLSEENDAIILRTYVRHTIVKVCVVGFGRKNDQFSRNVELLTPGFRLAMRIHNFRVIFNEYDAILSPTYVGHIIIKVCVVGFGRTNDQFSRNMVTSGFSLAMRIHDFGLSEENDAIILRTYVGHTIVKVCVVGFGRKTTNSQEMWNSVTYACNENSQFQTNSDEYDAVLLCSYVAHVIIKNNSDEYGASLTHSYIAQVITTVCVVR